ncbi:hypothetical protein ACC690_39700, partial [Rhizobium johnstonii]
RNARVSSRGVMLASSSQTTGVMMNFESGRNTLNARSDHSLKGLSGPKISMKIFVSTTTDEFMEWLRGTRDDLGPR